MFKKPSILLCTAILLALAGCGSSSSSSDDESTVGPNGLPNDFFNDFFNFDDDCEFQDAGCYDETIPNRAGTNGLEVTRFNGNWQSECIQVPDDEQLFDPAQDASHTTIQMSISGQAATRTVYLYNDADCAVPSSPAVVESTLDIFYAGYFDDTAEDIQRSMETDNGDTFFSSAGRFEVFINNSLVNLTPTAITIDGSAPTEAQQADLEARRAFNTRYTIMGNRLNGIRMGEGGPSNFTSGRSSDGRILDHSSASSYTYDLQ